MRVRVLDKISPQNFISLVSGVCHKVDVLKLLLAHPGLTALTLNKKQEDGATPVMVAAKKNKLEQLEILAADLRVDLETTDKEGRSLEQVAR